MSRASWILLGVTGPIAWAVSTAARPEIVETAYSRGVTLRIAAALGALTGGVGFSVAEAATPVLAVGLLGGLVVTWRRAGGARRWAWSVLPRSAMVGCAVYALFVGVWGLNYRRVPIGESLGLDATSPTIEELRAVTEESVQLANTTRLTVKEDALGVAALSTDLPATLRRASVAWATARGVLPGDPRFFHGQFADPKPLVTSLGFSYLRISGIYIPFTGEPNVNVDGPAFGVPFSACHEIAHQRGVAREDEANFTAWMVGRQSPEPDFAYSAAYVGLMYALNALADADEAAAVALRKTLSPAVERDVQAKRAYLARTESHVADVSHEMNHAYLQSNGVDDGVESYGRMVDLMIAERRRREGGARNGG